MLDIITGLIEEGEAALKEAGENAKSTEDHLQATSDEKKQDGSEAQADVSLNPEDDDRTKETKDHAKTQDKEQEKFNDTAELEEALIIAASMGFEEATTLLPKVLEENALKGAALGAGVGLLPALIASGMDHSDAIDVINQIEKTGDNQQEIWSHIVPEDKLDDYNNLVDQKQEVVLNQLRDKASDPQAYFDKNGRLGMIGALTGAAAGGAAAPKKAKKPLQESTFEGDPKLDKAKEKSKPYRDVRKDNLKSYRKERDFSRKEGDHKFADRMQKEGQEVRKSNRI